MKENKNNQMAYREQAYEFSRALKKNYVHFTKLIRSTNIILSHPSPTQIPNAQYLTE